MAKCDMCGNGCAASHMAQDARKPDVVAAVAVAVAVAARKA